MDNKITPKQLELLTSLSEQKNQPNEHAKLITSIATMNMNQAKFYITKLMNSKFLVDMATFELNENISQNGPEAYTKQAEVKRMERSNIQFKHKLEVFMTGDIDHKALIYLDLDQIGHEDWDAFKVFMSKYKFDIEKEILEHLKFRKMDDGLCHQQVESV